MEERFKVVINENADPIFTRSFFEGVMALGEVMEDNPEGNAKLIYCHKGNNVVLYEQISARHGIVEQIFYAYIRADITSLQNMYTRGLLSDNEKNKLNIIQ